MNHKHLIDKANELKEMYEQSKKDFLDASPDKASARKLIEEAKKAINSGDISKLQAMADREQAKLFKTISKEEKEEFIKSKERKDELIKDIQDASKDNYNK